LPLSTILIFDFRIVPTVWYFRIVSTVWYFRIVPTVWYFRIVPTVWYFRIVSTVWYFRIVPIQRNKNRILFNSVELSTLYIILRENIIK
jgi:hypothetical protein